jgi:hypothetical protein
VNRVWKGGVELWPKGAMELTSSMSEFVRRDVTPLFDFSSLRWAWLLWEPLNCRARAGAGSRADALLMSLRRRDSLGRNGRSPRY